MRHLVLIAILFLMFISTALAEDSYLVVSADVIESYDPPLERVLPNDGLLYNWNFQQVNGAVDIHDSPNGRVIGSRPQGEYFVSVVSRRDGWSEINPGEWVLSSKLSPAPISRVGGLLLQGELIYPVGWLRNNVQPSIKPGEEAKPLEVLPKYGLVHVFSETTIDGERWVQIGNEQWVKIENVSVVKPIERPADVDTHYWVGVDLAEQVIIAYEGEKPVFASLVATGLEESPTAEGLFHVYVRFHHRLMRRGNPDEPFFYYMEDVPYTMYFNGDMALHGAYWHDSFGRQRSHGCVNMSLTSAHWIYNFLSQEMDFENPDDIYPAVYVYRNA